MLYSFAIALVKFVMFFVFRIKKTGIENVPKEGGVILAINHKSDLDPVMIGITSPRKLNFMAKAELFKNKLFGGLIKRLGAFPVHRNSGDVGALKTSFKILNAGGAMLIFPEGGRVKKGEKRGAKPGVAMISQKTNVPVIPVYIGGEYKWMHKVTVTYGKPISFEEYQGQKLSVDDIQLLADNILNEIYSLGQG